MTYRKTVRTAFVATGLALSTATFIAMPASAADPVYTSFFSNVAVGGYDPVAYFTQSKPLKGSKKYQLSHRGAKWYFSSQANLDAFQANPAAYAPQYGGYCAWAVSQGYTASGNPNNWAIEDGKLYLNYNDDVQQTWDSDRSGFIELADDNWPTVLN